jgi:hypothetical protein
MIYPMYYSCDLGDHDSIYLATSSLACANKPVSFFAVYATKGYLLLKYEARERHDSLKNNPDHKPSARE